MNNAPMVHNLETMQVFEVRNLIQPPSRRKSRQNCRFPDRFQVGLIPQKTWKHVALESGPITFPGAFESANCGSRVARKRLTSNTWWYMTIDKRLIVTTSVWVENWNGMFTKRASPHAWGFWVENTCSFPQCFTVGVPSTSSHLCRVWPKCSDLLLCRSAAFASTTIFRSPLSVWSKWGLARTDLFSLGMPPWELSEFLASHLDEDSTKNLWEVFSAFKFQTIQSLIFSNFYILWNCGTVNCDNKDRVGSHFDAPLMPALSARACRESVLRNKSLKILRLHDPTPG